MYSVGSMGMNILFFREKLSKLGAPFPEGFQLFPWKVYYTIRVMSVELCSGASFPQFFTRIMLSLTQNTAR